MTKHKKTEAARSDTTPLVVGGVALFALLALGAKEKPWVKPIDYDQTYVDPKKEAFADVLRQFYRAFASPQGMTLAQFQTGRNAVLARDFTWYKAPTTGASPTPTTNATQEQKQTEAIMLALPIFFTYAESALAVEGGVVNEAGFVRIVLNVMTRLELAAKADTANRSTPGPTTGTEGSSTAGGPTGTNTTEVPWTKAANK